MPKNHLIFPVFILIIIGLVGCLPVSRITRTPTVPVATLAPHSPEVFKGLISIWHLDDIYVEPALFDDTLQAALGKVCYLGDVYHSELVCLDSKTGELLWDDAINSGDTLEITTDGVYVLTIPTRLEKYDFNSGKIKWQVPINFRSAFHLYKVNNELQLHSVNDYLWVFDSKGRTLREKHGDDILVSLPDVEFIMFNGLEMRRTQTGEKIWKVEDRDLYYAPLITQQVIFLRSGRDSEKASAIERMSGKLLWQEENVVSNIAYSPDQRIAFMLTEKGELVSKSDQDGQQMLLARFSPITLFKAGQPAYGFYFLTYDDQEHMLFVYMGDTKQLFAYKVGE